MVGREVSQLSIQGRTVKSMVPDNSGGYGLRSVAFQLRSSSKSSSGHAAAAAAAGAGMLQLHRPLRCGRCTAATALRQLLHSSAISAPAAGWCAMGWGSCPLAARWFLRAWG